MLECGNERLDPISVVNGVWGAWREMAPVFLRQQRDTDFHIEQRLPEASA